MMIRAEELDWIGKSDSHLEGRGQNAEVLAQPMEWASDDGRHIW